MLNKYWEDLIKENEKLRFSVCSRKAFVFLKRVYKYNMFEKRDGSIATRVIVDGEVVQDESMVHKHIMDALKLIQVDSRFPTYPEQHAFPVLENLTDDDLNNLLNRLWPGKAITTDCIHDSIFKKDNRGKVLTIFRDLWNGKNIQDFHFHARLIPLNKKHPEAPRPDQIRPIVINSSIVKTLEIRLLPKLQEYLKMKLHRSQIGFVDGMDIFINIWRALDRIQEIRAQKKLCYCLFLDFQSAYNTIPHTLLFEKLQKVLNENEIQLIRAIYSRTKITLGNEVMQPNVGVAQGSVISPALFNIFAESLLNELQESGYNINDILAFADDHLIMNLTKGDLRRAIKLVKEWSHHNNTP